MPKSIYRDVTNVIEIDHDFLRISITRCICGKKFDFWELRIGSEELNQFESYPRGCKCGRKFLFKKPAIRVYEVLEG